ncbi:MAG: thioredoxin family protein [Desulfurococcales archaeon]|nr:thioredoxin family protein [Desulfurococcales archaeon]
MDEVRSLARKLSEELLKRGQYIEKLAKDPVPEVTRHELDDVLKGNKVVFLFFTADWCGPCISFLETFRNVALELSKPGIYFGRVDVDRSYSISERYNIERIPSIAVFVNGKIVDVIVGSMGKSALRSRLERYIEKAESGGNSA